jgi:large subunit ribosomal protein L6
MSRIGKLPIAAPKGVTFKVDGQDVDVKGPLGVITANPGLPRTWAVSIKRTF